MSGAPTASCAGLSAPARAVLLMVVAGVFFAATAGLVRYSTQEMHPFQAAFLRSAFGLLLMLPLVVRGGLGGLRMRRPGLHLVRGVLSAFATFFWFFALWQIPIGEAVALNFTAPLFATVLAALVLHEAVRARRWTATAIGFVGVLIVLRPGLEVVSAGAMLAIASAGIIACNMMIVRVLSQQDNVRTVVLSFSFYLTLFTLPPALFVWQTPSWEGLAATAALGFFATAAHLCFTRAMASAEASAIVPLDFIRLPFAAVIGFVWFGEVPDIWTAVGALIIASAAVYIAQREIVAARRTPTLGNP